MPDQHQPLPTHPMFLHIQTLLAQSHQQSDARVQPLQLRIAEIESDLAKARVDGARSTQRKAEKDALLQQVQQAKSRNEALVASEARGRAALKYAELRVKELEGEREELKAGEDRLTAALVQAKKFADAWSASVARLQAQLSRDDSVASGEDANPPLHVINPNNGLDRFVFLFPQPRFQSRSFRSRVIWRPAASPFPPTTFSALSTTFIPDETTRSSLARHCVALGNVLSLSRRHALLSDQLQAVDKQAIFSRLLAVLEGTRYDLGVGGMIGRAGGLQGQLRDACTEGPRLSEGDSHRDAFQTAFAAIQNDPAGADVAPPPGFSLDPPGSGSPRAGKRLRTSQTCS